MDNGIVLESAIIVLLILLALAVAFMRMRTQRHRRDAAARYKREDEENLDAKKTRCNVRTKRHDDA